MEGDTKDLCGTTSYACNIMIHRTRRQAVQHKTHSSRPDSIYNGNTSMPVDERHRIGVDTFSPFKIGEAPVTLARNKGERVRRKLANSFFWAYVTRFEREL